MTVIYPPRIESHDAHRECRKNLSGTHKGNRWCLDHRVPVKDAESVE